jgi:thiamine pyrophosphate-dependent acetolactate synthase large subunit-like protein
VLNDGALSLIKLKQAKMQMEPRAVDFGAPRFDVIGKGFGADAARVDTIEDFAAALRAAVAARRFTVIDVVIDPAEYMEQM